MTLPVTPRQAGRLRGALRAQLRESERKLSSLRIAACQADTAGQITLACVIRNLAQDVSDDVDAMVALLGALAPRKVAPAATLAEAA